MSQSPMSQSPVNPPMPQPPRPAQGTDTPDTAETPVGIGEFGQILRRRWRVIAATTALVTGLGLVASVLIKPQYTASTSIFVDPRNRASFQIEASGTGAGYDPNLVDSQIVLIESDTVLQRVIEMEKLLQDAEFTRGAGDAASNALRNLKEAVKVKRPDRTYVVEIQVRAQEPDKAARIANAMARAYLSDGRDSKSETAQREENWLETHLQNLQIRLKEAEAKVEAYKVENKILGVEGRLVGEQQLSETNRGIVEAQRKAAEAKAILDQVEELKRNGRLLDATSEALRSATIDRLRGQIAEITRLEANSRMTLGPRHPASLEIREQLVETRRLITEELSRIAENARSGYAVARGNVTAMERQLDSLKRDATGINKTLLRLRELERAVDAQKAVYEKFLRDKEQIARLSVDTPAGRVIAPAIAPQFKSFPNRPLIIILAFATGLFAGVGLALVLETLSRGRTPTRAGFRMPGQSARQDGYAAPEYAAPEPPSLDPYAPAMPAHPETAPAATLAILPAPATGPRLRWIRSADRQSSDRNSGAKGSVALDAVDREPNSPYAREIGRLAAKISGMIDSDTSVTLMVSGARADAGSPALSANLARALAAEQHSVLLVDAAGGRNGLTAELAATGTPVEIEIAGQKQRALKLPTQGRTGVYLMPYGGVRLPRASGRLPRAPAPTLILIDGPPMGSAELDRIDIDHRIDGVIALIPAGMDPAGPIAAAFNRRFGPSLMGLVGQAA